MPNRGCGCKQPIAQQIGENGQVEQQFVQGGEFIPDPGDLRYTGIRLPLPPGFPVGENGACAGAESAVNSIKLVVDEMIANTAAWDEIAGFITFLIGLIGIFIPIWAAIVAIVGTVVAFLLFIGNAAVAAAMTEEVYETMKCCFACYIDNDRNVSTAQFQQIQACLDTELTGNARHIVYHLLNLIGPVGLSNAAKMLPVTGADCSECGCDCGDLSVGEFGTGLVERPDIGAGWWEITTENSFPPVPSGNGDFYAIVIVSACCCLTNYDYPEGLTNAPAGNRVAYGCDEVTHTGNYGMNAGLVNAILFRAFEAGTLTFKIESICP